MPIDHYFTIGKPHLAQGRPCEDYAWSTTLPGGLLLGVVADGCSGAWANTDVGARALAFAFEKAVAARQTLPNAWFDETFYADIRALFAAHRISTGYLDYYATVMGLVASHDHAAVYLFGDGVLTLRFADGRYQVMEFDWQRNTPFYLAYTLDPGAQAHFIQELGNDADRAVRCQNTIFSMVDGIPEVIAEDESWLPFAAFEHGYRLEFDVVAQGIQAMAVFSDGVARLGAGGEPIAQVTSHFLAFKNFRGEFVKRRMLSALAAYQKQGIEPQDDLAVACAWFGES